MKTWQESAWQLSDAAKLEPFTRTRAGWFVALVGSPQTGLKINTLQDPGGELSNIALTFSVYIALSKYEKGYGEFETVWLTRHDLNTGFLARGPDRA